MKIFFFMVHFEHESLLFNRSKMDVMSVQNLPAMEVSHDDEQD
jgi:hypothetical protein